MTSSNMFSRVDSIALWRYCRSCSSYIIPYHFRVKDDMRMSSSSSHIEIHLLTFPHSTSIQYEVVARATIQVRDNSRLGGTVRATMKRPICKIVRLTLHMALLLSPLGSEEGGGVR